MFMCEVSFIDHFCTKSITTYFVLYLLVVTYLAPSSFFPLMYIGLNNLYLKITSVEYSF